MKNVSLVIELLANLKFLCCSSVFDFSHANLEKLRGGSGPNWPELLLDDLYPITMKMI